LAALLDSVGVAIESGAVVPKEISDWNLGLRNRMISMGSRFEPLAQKLMEWESQKGFRRFDQEFAEKQQERFDKISSEEKRGKEARRRVERMIDRTVEELSDSQERKLTELLAKNPLLLEWENRSTVFRKFQAVREIPRERQKFVKAFFTNWESLQSEGYLTAQNQYRASWENYLAWLIAQLSPEQTSTVSKNLRALAKELNQLAIVEE
jgi:ribosomal protein L17